ncbi:hypothetical protein QFC19_000129 [Naganishia cerealis]|uniref:Uncharacterized protein n=1 Tax=Naganishia cerealis TaxID=610337 RepID=A0ACC2WQ74_9TREE|nr:hypothetical protein QFC19_000129 [Naganishia cerealis]
MPLLPPSHFSFSSASTGTQQLPSSGSHVLVTDTLNASADFVIYHLVIEALRSGRPPSTATTRAVAIVDFSGGRKSAAHWEAIGKKLGAPIPLKRSDNFSLITPTSHTFSTSSTAAQASPSLFSDDDEPSLKAVYQSILKALDGKEGSLIVLDELSELLVLGFPSQEVTRFVRAVISISRKVVLSTTGPANDAYIFLIPEQHNAIVVTHLHTDSLGSNSAVMSFQPNAREQTPNSDLDLLLRLLRLGGGVWWRIEGLRTGRSGVVTGEISSHPLLPLPIDVKTSATYSVPQIPRAHPLQYRLDDTGMKTFAKGTGEGYL